MVNKRAISYLLCAGTVLFLGKVAIAHKAATDEEFEIADAAIIDSQVSDPAATTTTTISSDEVSAELDAVVKAKAAAIAEPFDPVKLAQKYVMESCFMAFFVVCFVVLFMGKRHNAALA